VMIGSFLLFSNPWQYMQHDFGVKVR